MTAVLDRRIEEFLREILGVRTVPDRRVIGTSNIGAAARSDGLSQRQPLHNVMHVFGALAGIGIEHVDPRPHFRDHHVFRGERLFDLTHPRRVLDLGLGAISRAIAQPAVLPRQFPRIIALEKDWTTETDRLAGRSRQRGSGCADKGTTSHG